MSKRNTGNVVYVKKNYGFLSTEINEHKVKLFFIVKSEMIDDKNYFIPGDKVNFLTRNISIRGTNVVTAYDIKACEDSKKIHIRIDRNIDYDRFNDYEYVLECDIDDEFKDELINQERNVALFFIDWILFIEKNAKDIIKHILDVNKVDFSSFIELVKNNNKSKKFIADSLKRIKDNTLFRYEAEYISYKSKENDPNDVEVVKVPILMLLDQLTLNELCIIVEIVYDNYTKIISEDLKILFFYIKNLLPDIIFIRNKAAHGNFIIPSIIDDVFSPSYFYEMSSIMPNWNSNENMNDVEKYVAFEFIRYQTRSMAKRGINLAGIDAGPLAIGLFFTKSLLINPAKKSFFSFAFLAMCIFSYWKSEAYDEFMGSLGAIGLLALDNSEQSIYARLPKKDPIMIKLSRVLAPIFMHTSSPEIFKIYSKINTNLSKTKIND